MAETTTQARPYAEAIFKRARESGELSAWSRALQTAAQVVADERVQRLIGDPRVGEDDLVSLFTDVCGDALGHEARNMIRLLAANDRLGVLPDIAALYERRRGEAEGTVEAEVVSAFPLNDDEERSITDALRRRLGREVTLTCRTDTALMGGVVIRAGDLVIDGSVRGRLEQLESALRR